MAVETSTSSSSPPSSSVENTYGIDVPFEVQYQLDELASFYGISSGFEIHQILAQQRYPKKRRLDTSFPMAPKPGNMDIHQSTNGLAVSAPYDQSHGRYGTSSSWAESVSSATSPLTSRIAGLASFLCPCCGTGLKQHDGELMTFPLFLSSFQVMSTCP